MTARMLSIRLAFLACGRASIPRTHCFRTRACRWLGHIGMQAVLVTTMLSDCLRCLVLVTGKEFPQAYQASGHLA